MFKVGTAVSAIIRIIYFRNVIGCKEVVPEHIQINQEWNYSGVWNAFCQHLSPGREVNAAFCMWRYLTNNLTFGDNIYLKYDLPLNDLLIFSLVFRHFSSCFGICPPGFD